MIIPARIQPVISDRLRGRRRSNCAPRVISQARTGKPEATSSCSSRAVPQNSPKKKAPPKDHGADGVYALQGVQLHGPRQPIEELPQPTPLLVATNAHFVPPASPALNLYQGPRVTHEVVTGPCVAEAIRMHGPLGF